MKKRVEQFDGEQLFSLLEKAGRPLRLDDILRLGAYSRRLKRDILEELHGLAREGEVVRLRADGIAFFDANGEKTHPLCNERVRASALHMPSQKSGNGLGQFVLHFARGQLLGPSRKEDAAQHIPLG